MKASLTVNDVADAIAVIFRVSPPIVIRSPTTNCVSKYDADPVTVFESAVVVTVPIICDAGCEYAERTDLAKAFAEIAELYDFARTTAPVADAIEMTTNTSVPPSVIVIKSPTLSSP